jgi:hypothetical protein
MEEGGQHGPAAIIIRSDPTAMEFLSSPPPYGRLPPGRRAYNNCAGASRIGARSALFPHCLCLGPSPYCRSASLACC